MYFAEFSVNSQTIFMEFCRRYFLVMFVGILKEINEKYVAQFNQFNITSTILTYWEQNGDPILFIVGTALQTLNQH